VHGDGGGVDGDEEGACVCLGKMDKIWVKCARETESPIYSQAI
jgi:hypothetical protein